MQIGLQGQPCLIAVAHKLWPATRQQLAPIQLLVVTRQNQPSVCTLQLHTKDPVDLATETGPTQMAYRSKLQAAAA